MIWNPDEPRSRRHSAPAPDEARSSTIREREAERQRLEREADPVYWNSRWCALYRGEGRSIAEIAAAHGRDEAEVRQGIDEILQAQLGVTLEQFEAERQAAMERARAAWRRARGAVRA